MKKVDVWQQLKGRIIVEMCTSKRIVSPLLFFHFIYYYRFYYYLLLLLLFVFLKVLS